MDRGIPVNVLEIIQSPFSRRAACVAPFPVALHRVIFRNGACKLVGPQGARRRDFLDNPAAKVNRAPTLT
eukprot:CAMPEP_0204130596 /NCGR_PEP_ID=MMETSP0361-20130328/13454_1 /ASSEMBLY_ACC=CAM_ASM_000343 /TAXON_ID=268821 /ORGANISM="Scrippsiella Hangoei, Strain SHTV-5" /LENGTH=69 /DNA_ID=CAMNT_0051083203 /DNA_START=10 /DNA_END=215 /DNA_ORIENTATION=+